MCSGRRCHAFQAGDPAQSGCLHLPLSLEDCRLCSSDTVSLALCLLITNAVLIGRFDQQLTAIASIYATASSSIADLGRWARRSLGRQSTGRQRSWPCGLGVGARSSFVCQLPGVGASGCGSPAPQHSGNSQGTGAVQGRSKVSARHENCQARSGLLRFTRLHSCPLCIV
jgi:hypothetical protein